MTTIDDLKRVINSLRDVLELVEYCILDMKIINSYGNQRKPRQPPWTQVNREMVRFGGMQAWGGLKEILRYSIDIYIPNLNLTNPVGVDDLKLFLIRDVIDRLCIGDRSAVLDYPQALGELLIFPIEKTLLECRNELS